MRIIFLLALHIRQKKMNWKSFNIDLDNCFDLSIEIGNPYRHVKAWYVDDPKIEPVIGDNFVGSVAAGSSVNFRNISFNPHGHGTHTETFGHITKEIYSVNSIQFPLLMMAQLITVDPIQKGDDKYISLEQIQSKVKGGREIEALVLRTLPNDNKLNKDYSSSNPPYLEEAIAPYLHSLGIKHLLIDLPSVDKEVDGGELAFHHAFWSIPDSPRMENTITEFIYVQDEIQDDFYALNLQVAPFENDASPSRPVLYKFKA